MVSRGTAPRGLAAEVNALESREHENDGPSDGAFPATERRLDVPENWGSMNDLKFCPTWCTGAREPPA